MNDGAEVIAPAAPAALPTMRRARALAAASVALGAASFLVLPVPLPSAFPWLTLALSLAGVIAAIMSFRARPRGRLAAGLAIGGLLLSLTFPCLIVFVFVHYFNWKG
jgi:hypothetical protein